MDSDLRQRDRNIAKRITELDAIFKRLYEDNISDKLSDERFQKLSADYEKEEQEPQGADEFPSERSGAGGKQIGGW